MSCTYGTYPAVPVRCPPAAPPCFRVPLGFRLSLAGMSTIASEYGLGSSSRNFPDPPCSSPPLEIQFNQRDDADVAEWDSWETASVTPCVQESIPLEKSGITSPTKQSEFWKKQTVYKNSIAAKLRQAGFHVLADKLELCHTHYTVATCKNCSSVRKFPNRCDNFICPECAHHLQYRRRQQIEWWCKLITQPKHVVLTIRSIPDISAGHVRQMKRYLASLRRRKFCHGWRGGFYRIECTHGRSGWHLHIHLLIDADWIDQDQLKQQWNSVTGGGGYIVKVKDCRGEDYLREVTKYVVKSSSLAKWTSDKLVQFVTAFTGQRLFGVFGNLYAARTRFRDFIHDLKDHRRACDCEDPQVSYQTEEEFARSKLPRIPIFRPRPPPPAEVQIHLIPEQHQCRD